MGAPHIDIVPRTDTVTDWDTFAGNTSKILFAQGLVQPSVAGKQFTVMASVNAAQGVVAG
jgi:hypothetical protein